MLVGENVGVGDDLFGLAGRKSKKNKGRKTRQGWQPDVEPSAAIQTPAIPDGPYSTESEIQGMGAVVPMLPIMAPLSERPTEVMLSDLGRRGGGGRRHWGGGRRYGYGYPYMYPPAYYYQQVEEPKPKFVLVDPSGKPVTIVRELPATLPPGYTFRPATPTEAATGVLTGFGNYSKYSSGQTAWADNSDVFGLDGDSLF